MLERLVSHRRCRACTYSSKNMHLSAHDGSNAACIRSLAMRRVELSRVSSAHIFLGFTPSQQASFDLNALTYLATGSRCTMTCMLPGFRDVDTEGAPHWVKACTNGFLPEPNGLPIMARYKALKSDVDPVFPGTHSVKEKFLYSYLKYGLLYPGMRRVAAWDTINRSSPQRRPMELPAAGSQLQSLVIPGLCCNGHGVLCAGGGLEPAAGEQGEAGPPRTFGWKCT